MSFSMFSLYLSDSEFKRILELKERGEYSTLLDNDGKGIGMYIMNRLIQMNKGDIIYYNESKDKTYISDVPYSKKTFKVKLPTPPTM